MACRIFIGELIEQTLREKGFTVSEFADAIGVQRPNAYRIFHLHSIDTDLLLRISEFLKHDFFSDYSTQLSTQRTQRVVSE